MILTIKTDSPQAELALYEGSKKVQYNSWSAERKLAEQIHGRIERILANQKIGYSDITGIIFFKGPGSYTSLRIGVSVAKALANGLNVPIVGTNKSDWIKRGLAKLFIGKNEKMLVPEYGAPPKTTKPKK